MYHHRDIEESHKDPEVVPTIDPRDWLKNLETVDDYTRVFCGVYGQPISYGLWEDLIAPVEASDSMYCANGINNFTHDEEMIARGLILSESAALGTDPEEIGPFSASFITNRERIWDNMVAIFQGSDA